MTTPDLVARLIKAGADVNAMNDYGSTPLGEAAVTGDAAVIKRLLDAGANAGAPGKDGETPLMVVARGGNVEAARLLLDHGADVNAQEAWRGQTALIWAAAQKQPEMVRLLLKRGANANARSTVPEWDRQVSAERRRQYRPFGGLTALMYAAREGCVECARALVEGGADPDLPGYRGITPLIMAIDNLNFDTAAYLLDAGASLDVWDWWGRTPLYMAVDMNTLPHGGRPDRASTDETTGLQLIERMLAKGASPNSQLKLLPPYRERGADRGCDALLVTGSTPLLRAAKTFDVPAMKLLIAHGARLDLPNSSGVTPFMAAAGYGSLECDIRGYGPGIPHYTDDGRASEVDRGVAGADRRRRRRERRNDGRRERARWARQEPRADGAVRRRVLGLDRRGQIPRRSWRETRHAGLPGTNRRRCRARARGRARARRLDQGVQGDRRRDTAAL